MHNLKDVKSTGSESYALGMRLVLLIAVLALLSSPAWAQSYVQQAVGDGASPLTAQFTDQNDAAENTIWVAVSGSQYVACSSTAPTDSEGNTFHLLATIVGTGSLDQANQCVFAAFNIVGGTKDTVTCYGTNTIFAIACNIVELHGVNAFDSATCIANACVTDGNGSGILSSPAINTNFPNEILLGYATKSMGGDCPSTFAGPGAGYTEINSASVQFEYKVVSSLQVGATATVDKGSIPCEWSLGIYAFYQASALTLTLNPETVAGGFTSVGTVGLSAPAPPGGATVMLSSSNTAVVTVPPRCSCRLALPQPHSRSTQVP